MASEVLFEKYRPRKLKDLIGAETRKRVDAIEKLIEKKKLSAAMLLIGETGSGKTTVAKIIAEMSTQMPELDVIEMNMSDTTGIDDIRKMRDGLYMSGSGGTKTYLLDEAHNMSKQAQDCLLKPLEDIVKMSNGCRVILGTDTPDNLDEALRGRCQEFQFFRPKPEEMEEYLLKVIIPTENISIAPDALKKLCQNSPNMRKLLNNLQGLMGGGQITIEQVEEFVGTTAMDESDDSFILTRLLLWPEMFFEWKKPNPIQAWEFIAPELAKQLETKDPKKLAYGIAGYCRNNLLSLKYRKNSKGELKKDAGAQQFVRMQRVLRVFSQDIFQAVPANRFLTLYYEALTLVLK